MKKILLATTVLAFAGSAFAATVSGSVTTKYFLKDGDNTDKAFKTEGDVSFSGSRTSSNGLTFGGTYKVKVGNAKTTDAVHTSATLNSSRSDVSGKASNPDTDGNSVSKVLNGNSLNEGEFDKGIQTASEVSAFVSGSWGKVNLGKHDSAGDAAGIGDTVTNGVTYSSPAFSGFSALYTYGAAKTEARGFGVKYDGAFSGVDLTFAYATLNKQYGTDDDAKDVKKNGWKFSVGMSGITFEYKNSKNRNDTVTKTTGFALKYAASNWDVKYSSDDDTKEEGKEKTTKIVANYTVAEGLKVILEDKKVGDTKTTYIGTKISF